MSMTTNPDGARTKHCAVAFAFGLQRKPAVMRGGADRVLACSIEHHQGYVSAWARATCRFLDGPLKHRTQANQRRERGRVESGL